MYDTPHKSVKSVLDHFSSVLASTTIPLAAFNFSLSFLLTYTTSLPPKPCSHCTRYTCCHWFSSLILISSFNIPNLTVHIPILHETSRHHVCPNPQPQTIFAYMVQSLRLQALFCLSQTIHLTILLCTTEDLLTVVVRH